MVRTRFFVLLLFLFLFCFVFLVCVLIYSYQFESGFHCFVSVVTLKARDLTAVENTDYSIDATTVTVPDGGMTAVIVSAMADGFGEGTEQFEISIVLNAAYTVGTPSKATVYIKDVIGDETGDSTTGDGTFKKVQSKQYELSYFKHIIR